MLPQQSSLLGVPVSLSRTTAASLTTMCDMIAAPASCIVTFVNPNAFHLRSIDQGYANMLWHFDLILADGIGVVKALQWVNGEKVERQSFDTTSLFHPLLSRLNGSRRSLCIVGGEPGVAHRAMHKMRRAYPDIDYRGSLDGYQEFNRIIEWIKGRGSDVVLVGMGAPSQEAVLLRLKQDGFNGLGLTCGGFLDQYVSNDTYYPQMIDRLDLRWLYRLIREPRRLRRRYLIQYQAFLFDVFNAFWNKFLKRRHGRSHIWQAGRHYRANPD